MSRNICICQDFLTEAHKARITAAAEAAGFTPHFFTPEQFDQASACLQSCEVLFSHLPELLRTAPAGLKWYCCSYAGVDVYCQDESLFPTPACLLTNSSGAYGVTIAEHIVMVLLMLLRQMPVYQASIAQRGWAGVQPTRSIFGSSITVLGTGNIGTTFAHRARGLGAGRITGVCRSGSCPDPVYDQVLPISRLEEVLPRTELLVMALPGTPETVRILNRTRIALLPSSAIVVNVGRGTAIDQEALADALNGGRLAGAALDVVDPEPLPRDHPLWDAKNLLLTPHISGNMALGYTADTAVDMFCQDLANYAAGRPLAHLVDRKRGY